MDLKRAGQIVLFRFPQTDLTESKLRPALLVTKTPDEYNDWLICMITSQTKQYKSSLDELISKNDEDYVLSGLKSESIIRTTRLAVVNEEILVGNIGEIKQNRLERIKKHISEWILKD